MDVENPNGELLPGAFLSVHIKLSSQTVDAVAPVNALIFRSAGMQVAVVRDGKAELEPVTIGRDFGTEVEVVSADGPDER